MFCLRKLTQYIFILNYFEKTYKKSSKQNKIDIEVLKTLRTPFLKCTPRHFKKFKMSKHSATLQNTFKKQNSKEKNLIQ